MQCNNDSDSESFNLSHVTRVCVWVCFFMYEHICCIRIPNAAYMFISEYSEISCKGRASIRCCASHCKDTWHSILPTHHQYHLEAASWQVRRGRTLVQHVAEDNLACTWRNPHRLQLAVSRAGSSWWTNRSPFGRWICNQKFGEKFSIY